jgi:hypothetical protein
MDRMMRLGDHLAKLVPFALFAYGGYGLFLAHVLAVREVPAPAGMGQVINYGIAHVRAPGGAGDVLSQAIVVLAAATWLLAVTGAPGGRALSAAFAQLRGTGGQPKSVPPLLLLPVTFLWEELFSQQLCSRRTASRSSRRSAAPPSCSAR